MFSNTAPELYRNGFVAGWQVPCNLEPFDLVNDGFDDLANRPEAERMEDKLGAHMFWKSSDPSDWNYMQIGSAVPGGSGGANYKINGGSDYLALCQKQAAANGRGGYWTVFSDVQYRHESVWFPQQYPDHDRRTFELALELQGRLPQMHCNPFHIKDIFKWIGAHKGQIQQSVSQGASAFGGARASGYANEFNKFLDVWFK